VVRDPDVFEEGLTGGPGDEIIFSIRQIADPTDPDGYYATGSELFVYNADGTFGFLHHGGHIWDQAWTLANLEILGGTIQEGNYGVIDINAIEAVGETSVPEPSTCLLLLMGFVPIALLLRKKRMTRS
jgi:hypothetical protein